MRVLAALALLLVAVTIGAAIYFFGGFYDVTASGHGNPAVDWAVRQVREASIDKHVNAPPQPAWFDKAETVQAGAREFVEEGCVNCHGAPGVKPGEFTRGMNPKPPDLGPVGEEDPPEHIFWIVKHGIRMTGMPAFGSHASDDEIWRTVAFIKQMRNVSPPQFEQWTIESDTTENKSTSGEGSRAQ